jgi:hypothetical protein
MKENVKKIGWSEFGFSLFYGKDFNVKKIKLSL